MKTDIELRCRKCGDIMNEYNLYDEKGVRIESYQCPRCFETKDVLRVI